MGSTTEEIFFGDKIGKNWNNRDIAKFHAHNSNGLVKRKREINCRIGELVENGVIPSGWNLAYGTFSDFEEESMVMLARKRRVNRIALEVAIEMLEKKCEKVEAKLAEIE